MPAKPLLLGKPPPDQRHSTSCARRAIRMIRIGKEEEEWSEISAKEFQEMIAEAVPILYEELRAKEKGMEELEKGFVTFASGGMKGRGDGGGTRLYARLELGYSWENAATNIVLQFNYL